MTSPHYELAFFVCCPSLLLSLAFLPMIWCPQRAWRGDYRPRWPGMAGLGVAWFLFCGWWTASLLAGAWIIGQSYRQGLRNIRFVAGVVLMILGLYPVIQALGYATAMLIVAPNQF